LGSLFIISLLIPEDGIAFGSDATLRFFSVRSFFTEKEQSNSAYTDSLITAGLLTDDPEQPTEMIHSLDEVSIETDPAIEVDSVIPPRFSEARPALTDSVIEKRIDSIRKYVFPLDYGIGFEEEMHGFFHRLSKSKEAGDVVRVMHYGDSQIENDRMTSRIRYRFQEVFGGSGCGLVPAIPLYFGNPTFKQSIEGDWQRYTGFGKRDSLLEHNDYGVLVCFTDIPASENGDNPKLTFDFINGRRASRYQTLDIYLHAYGDSGIVHLYEGDSLIKSWNNVSPGYKVLSASFDNPPDEPALEFNLNGGGRVYGISFDPLYGIQFDNVAMRGSSGLEFSKINESLLDTMFTNLDPGLILLQFGGNVVPYIKNTAYYKKLFKRELTFLKQLKPGIPVIVIGPSDMSTKENGVFVTYPMLEPVRNALREAAVESGCGFWDMYEAMGGKNAIRHFVEADPPLAHADYVHFTMRGANLMARLFFDAVMLEYEKYKMLAQN